MASTEAVFKDMRDIYARLFDHHSALSGEAKYFLQQFEEKRNDREVGRLFETLEKMTDIRETQINKSHGFFPELANLKEQIDAALIKCEQIASKEFQTSKAETAEDRKKAREIEYQAFLKDIAEKKTLVDQAFGLKEEELKEYYKELEEKLEISSPTKD